MVRRENNIFDQEMHVFFADMQVLPRSATGSSMLLLQETENSMDIFITKDPRIGLIFNNFSHFNEFFMPMVSWDFF